MQIVFLKLKNWRNFLHAEANLGAITYVVGPNASGKSNFLDVFRFLRDIAKPEGGGLRTAIRDRDGLSKLRCLHARRDPELFIEAHLEDEEQGVKAKWVYRLGVKSEGVGANRPIVSKEEVVRSDGQVEQVLLRRPDREDEADSERLTQTALEQTQANKAFRALVECFSNATYLHLVPQLLKYGDRIGGKRLENDPFGQAFLERVAKASDKVLTSRLSRIKEALASAVPQFEDLRFVRDKSDGSPHLEAKYVHHRVNAGWQREGQLSDGTLRLIALFWLLLEGEGLLLLEEPELSLDEDVVRNLPRLLNQASRTTKKRKRQIIITTHSYALLSNKAVDGRWVLRIAPAHEGSEIVSPSDDELEAMRAGLSAADILLSQAHPHQANVMALRG